MEIGKFIWDVTSEREGCGTVRYCLGISLQKSQGVVGMKLAGGVTEGETGVGVLRVRGGA